MIRCGNCFKEITSGCTISDDVYCGVCDSAVIPEDLKRLKLLGLGALLIEKITELHTIPGIICENPSLRIMRYYRDTKS